MEWESDERKGPVVVSSEGWDGKLPRPRTDCTGDVDDDVDDIDF